MTTFGFDNILGDRGELEVNQWYVTAFWALIPTAAALAGIALGVAVVVAGKYINRRPILERGQR